MNKTLANWYIKNKNKIFIVLVLIVIIVIVNFLIRIFGRMQNHTINNEIANNIQQSINSNYNSISFDSDESAITGDKITDYQSKLGGEIDKFVTSCNQNDIEEAYNLLSDECKEELYPTLNEFITGYYNRVFNGQKKSISIENWIGNTYKMIIQNDFLSTGIYNPDGDFQDYVTININKNGDIKLNINGYIGREIIDKSATSNNVTINVLRVDKYMDYEKYTYKITNNTNDQILIDDKSISESMNIRDSNNIEYAAYSHEISLSELLFSPKETKELSIKYYNNFGSEKEIESIAFEKIVLNYGINTARKYGSIVINL